MTNVTDTININNNNHASRSAASPPSGSLDSSASNMSGSCSSSINQSQLSPNSSFSSSTASTAATNTQTMKNNFGLISIKAKPSSASSASSGFSSKLVKLYPDKQSSPDAGSIVKMTSHLPSLVNLGILTPATSPKQQPINQLMQNSNDVILPLTPISPNMSKNVNFNNITVADHITTTDET